MCLGWLHVILDERLYDEQFVDRWTLGFEQFAERVREYPLSRVSSITGVSEPLIREAARMYATTSPAVIPWTPITDQQVSSTSAIRLHCALRALTGNLDVPGGDVFHPFNADVIPETDLELHDALSEEQKAKQLGSDKHPVFTYRGMAALAGPTERVWGRRWANLLSGSYMANPTATFRAMAEDDPYPVRAFFSLGNNTLLGYANMQRIAKAICNQDLVVVHEHMMTPTAQLADYVLPGDSWLERPALVDGLGWVSILAPSEKAMEPPGECKSVYFFWRELALRMGFGEAFPWKTLEEVYDYRLEPTGMDWRTFAETYQMRLPRPQYRSYEKTGFATPSGKVELYSSVLAELGFDPLPYYREPPQPDADYPLRLFTGGRDDEYFQTGHRHVPELRRRKPEPTIYLHPEEAVGAKATEGDWMVVETRHGRAHAKLEIRPDMQRGLVRFPHGWWRPEAEQGSQSLSDAWLLADAQLCSDDDEFLDREQGIPHLKGIPCRVARLEGETEQ